MTDPVDQIIAGMGDSDKATLAAMSAATSWANGQFELRQRYPALVDAVQTRAQCVSYRLTPIGLAVRAALRERG